MHHPSYIKPAFPHFKTYVCSNNNNNNNNLFLIRRKLTSEYDQMRLCWSEAEPRRSSKWSVTYRVGFLPYFGAV